MKPLLHRAIDPEILPYAERHEVSGWTLGIAVAVAIGIIVGFWYTTVPFLVR